jgi:Spy/CpxP family protein refolding chaperone
MKIIPRPLHRVAQAGVLAAALIGPTLPGLAQDAAASNPRGSGQETGNFGLTPFYAVPAVALSPEATQKLRDLEDAQLRDRRALEDRFAQEMRALLVQQAADREALLAQLTGP